MNDREKWRERVGDIRACGSTWWWWSVSLLSQCSHYYWHGGSFKVPRFCQFSSLLLLWWLLYSLWVFHWILSDGKSLQVSRTLLSIQADLDYAVVWMVSILHRIFNSFSHSSKPFGSVLSALITIGIPDIRMFHIFLILWQGLSICSFFSLLVLLCDQLEWQNPLYGKPHLSLLSLLNSIRPGLLVCIKLSFGISI